MTERLTPADLDWPDDGSGPRSQRFGDVYFSAQDGLAESRAVFLAGCGLPKAWAGRRRFTVAELGFGTGLNILALLQLWRDTRPAEGRLSIFSVEAHPLSRQDAARAHAAWPELAPLSAMLLDAWPAPTPGAHRIDLSELNATLDLAQTDVETALAGWDGRADVLFLDGFAPATNPAMWSEAVLARVAQRSAPGARLATFTVAGAVRRGLQAQGLAVDKRPGFGRKRERLEAVAPGVSSDPPAPRHVAVIGAGIAGASLARALQRQGLAVTVVDDQADGSASANPAALVTPRLDAGGGALAALCAQAFRRAIALYARETPGAVLARGVLQLEATDRDGPRFDKIAAQPLWPVESMTRLNPAEASARLGEPLARGGLWLAEALTVEPRAVLDAWLTGAGRITARAARVKTVGDRIRVLDAGDAVIVEADAAVMAAGWGGADLAEASGVALPLTPARGQASWVEGSTPVATAWGGYVAPTRTGVLFGATHDRGDTAVDGRDADHERNRATLAAALPQLAGRLADRPVQGGAAVRATTFDRLPICGAVQGHERLFVLTGLGSRGFSFAPLLAEHLAARIAGGPSPVPADLAALFASERIN